eukprot:Nitzschia sp. Nitz4//scaffold243_size29414//15087//16436//NITZ4_008059-RA/size29414-processed-gene-0.7-mRNA-1//-1//CDS//3329543840//5665//frame0
MQDNKDGNKSKKQRLHLDRTLDNVSRQVAILAEKHKLEDRQAQKRGKNKLQPRHMEEFPSESLFDQFARVVCQAGVVARKELFETWAMALYVSNCFESQGLFRSTRRLADLACSHGLLSWALLLLLEQTSSSTTSEDEIEASNIKPLTPVSVVCVDLHMPKSAETIAAAMVRQWPHLKNCWDYVEGPAEAIVPDSSTLLMGVHACGLLSDKILQLAMSGSSPLALIPCCHSKKLLPVDQADDLLKQPSFTLADWIDQYRIQRLEQGGFSVYEAFLPEVVSPKNRIILAIPTEQATILKGKQDDTNLSLTFKGTPSWGVPQISIPVADMVESREKIKQMAGRQAADQRKERPPISLCVSMFLPTEWEQISATDLQSAMEVYLARSIHKDEKMPQVEAYSSEPFFHPEAKQYARTFRIHYHGCRSKAQAQKLHAIVRSSLPTSFPGVTVRY